MKKNLPKWFVAAFHGLRLQSWPEVCFGAPRIEGHRITTDFVAGRFAAGDEIDQMADEYNVHRKSIEDCLRFELRISRHRNLDLGKYRVTKINGGGRDVLQKS